MQLAENGMDVARLNMTHSDRQWHTDIINKIHKLNDSGFNIAIMVDTEGSEAHLKAQDPTRVEVPPTNRLQHLTCRLQHSHSITTRIPSRCEYATSAKAFTRVVGQLSPHVREVTPLANSLQCSDSGPTHAHVP